MSNLDKFYTKPEIAEMCLNYLSLTGLVNDTDVFLEPSAGNGSFLNKLPVTTLAYDIAPEAENIKKQDFLALDLPYSNLVTIGNPPFGKRSKLAIDFFNHAAKFSKIIAFILPVSFMKWGVQKELSGGWCLYDYLYLPQNSFTDGGKDFSVRCVFQIWTRDNYGKDKRILKAPPIKHPDFNIWQYNATPRAFSVVEENWTYAVYRQGYKDYSILFTQKDKQSIIEQMRGNIQFFFIEPLTKEANEIIANQMDFSSLAERNTATPGFGKADFVSYYLELKDAESSLRAKK